MTYLKSIKIKNIKSHLSTNIELNQHVNILSGIGNSGKSNIIRAINFVNENRPLGTKFLSNYGDKQFSAELEFAEGNTISLTRNVSKTKKGDYKIDSSVYKINNEEYTGFGTNVPDKVKECLNLSDINIQKQLDTPYLITSSGGEFTRTINKITHIDETDKWRKDLTKSINKFNSDIESIGIENENLTIKIKKYDDLDLINDYYILCETLTNKKEKLEEKFIKILDYISNLTFINFKLNIISDQLTNLKLNVETLKQHLGSIQLLDKKCEVVEKYFNINNKLNKYSNIDSISLDKLKALDSSLKIANDKNVTLETAIKILSKINKLQGINTLKENVASMKIMLDNKTKIEYNISQTGKLLKTVFRIETVTSEFENLYSDIKICPICFSEVDINKIKDRI